MEHQLSQQGEQLSLLQAENDNKKLGQNWLLLMEDIRRSPIDMVNISLFIGFYTCWVVLLLKLKVADLSPKTCWGNIQP